MTRQQKVLQTNTNYAHEVGFEYQTDPLLRATILHEEAQRVRREMKEELLLQEPAFNTGYMKAIGISTGSMVSGQRPNLGLLEEHLFQMGLE